MKSASPSRPHAEPAVVSAAGLPPSGHRRRFIRLAGGGTLAAALPLSGCGLGRIPDAAVAAWQGPAAGSGIRLSSLAWGILAPNPHNRQPWFARLESDDTLGISIDTERLLPETDPFGRQILIGTGAMIALTELAAAMRGFRVQTVLFPDGEFGERLDERPVARLRFLQGTASPAALDRRLFEAAPRRHTYRGDYLPARAPAEAFVADLKAENESMAARGLAGGIVGRPAGGPFAELDGIAREAWKIELSTAPTMLESMRLLRIGSGEIERYRDGISITDPMIVTLARLGMVDRESAPAPDSSIVRGQIDEFNAALDSTPAYYWLVSDANDRRSQVASGAAYLRAQLLAASHGLVMQPVSQALQEYPQVAGPYRRVQAALRQASGRAQATGQMLCRLGYPADPAGPAPAPRRGLQAHLRA